MTVREYCYGFDSQRCLWIEYRIEFLKHTTYTSTARHEDSVCTVALDTTLAVVYHVEAILGRAYAVVFDKV